MGIAIKTAELSAMVTYLNLFRSSYLYCITHAGTIEHLLIFHFLCASKTWHYNEAHRIAWG